MSYMFYILTPLYISDDYAEQEEAIVYFSLDTFEDFKRRAKKLEQDEYRISMFNYNVINISGSCGEEIREKLNIKHYDEEILTPQQFKDIEAPIEDDEVNEKPDACIIHIQEDGILWEWTGKYSGNRYETRQVTFKWIEEHITNSMRFITED